MISSCPRLHGITASQTVFLDEKNWEKAPFFGRSIIYKWENPAFFEAKSMKSSMNMGQCPGFEWGF
jgi:hypothetical protein